MPFLLVDDQLHLHAKTTSLVENEGTAGITAMGLWVLAGSLAQAKLSDGVITLGDATRLLLSKATATKSARLLVKYRLWEEHPEGWVFHDWFEAPMKYEPGLKIKAKRARAQELKRPEITEAVRARDRGLCRYCGIKLDLKNKYAANDKAETLDHVIPGLAAGTSNLVQACMKCNRLKAQRTPEQAGMTLRPAPTASDGTHQVTTLGDPARGSTSEPTRATAGARSDRHREEQAAPNASRTGAAEPATDPTVTRTTDEALTSATHDHPVSPPTPAQPEAATPQGDGAGEGLKEGSGEGHPQGPAGPTPPIPLEHQASHSGSPWHGWRGPPPDTGVDTCLTHHLDMPCRTCLAEARAQDVPLTAPTDPAPRSRGRRGRRGKTRPPGGDQ